MVDYNVSASPIRSPITLIHFCRAGEMEVITVIGSQEEEGGKKGDKMTAPRTHLPGSDTVITISG